MKLNSYQLKYIALITMMIDHFGIVFRNYMSNDFYLLLRGIGRISFPLFCFLITEGFFHTRNRMHYLYRLILFAFISEIPFDIALKGSLRDNIPGIFVWSSQNVFFTLALGFVAMMFLEYFDNRRELLFLGIIVFPIIGDLICCDYGSVGILTILLFYFYHKSASYPLYVCILPLLLTGLSFYPQFACILALFPISCYDGKRGRGYKYLFYILYPAHLLIYEWILRLNYFVR